MKFFGFLFFLFVLLAFGNWNIADALFEDPDPACQKPGSALVPTHPTPAWWSADVKALGQWMGGMASTYMTTKSICHFYFRRWREWNLDESECRDIGYLGATIVTFAVTSISRWRDSSPGTVGQPAGPPPPGRFDHLAGSEQLELPFKRDLKAIGYTYESFEFEPALLRDESEAMVYHIYGVQSPMLNNTVTDQHFVRYDGDKSGLAHMMLRAPASQQGKRNQRPGPGLKLSWRIVRGTSPPEPFRRLGVQNLAWNVGDDWAKRLQNAFDEDGDFTQYYGTLEMEPDFEVAFVVSGVTQLDRRFEDPLACSARD